MSTSGKSQNPNTEADAEAEAALLSQLQDKDFVCENVLLGTLPQAPPGLPSFSSSYWPS